MSNWLRTLPLRTCRAARPLHHANLRRERPRLEKLEDRLAPATTPTFVNDNWNLVADLGAPGVLDFGDLVNNANDTINTGGVAAVYGFNAFGTVTTTSVPGGPTGANPAFDSINDAIGETIVLGTVNVLEGTYNELVVVNKTINLLGAQAGVDARGRVAAETTVTSVGTIIELQTGATAVVIDGFTLSGGTRGIESTSGPIDNLQLLNNRIIGFSNAGVFLNDSGVDITVSQNVIDGSSKVGGGGLFHLDTDNFDGFQLINNNIVGGATGTGFFVDGNHNVGVSLTRAPLIQGNLIADNNTGMNLGTRAFEFGTIAANTFHSNNFDGLQGGIQNSAITRNTFSDNGRSGLALTSFGNAAADRGAQNTQVTENFFLGNAAEDIFLSASQAPGTISTNVIFGNSITSATGLTYGGTELIDASGNWWDSPTGPTLASHPIGTGAAIAGAGAANIDFTPWLHAGLDTDLAAGFQGSFDVLHVDDDSPQVGAAGLIQEAIDLATGATPTVIIEAGAYAESVAANKTGLVLDGATGLAADVVLDPPATGNGITVTADNVVIRDLRITGAGNALVAANQATLTLANLLLDGNTSGGSLSDIGTLNFTASTGADTVTISGAELAATGVQAISLSDVATLNAFGDSGADTFNVTPAVSMTINIDGDLPTPPAIPGDRLNVNTAGTTGASLSSTSTPTGLQGSYTFSNRAAVNFQEIETLGAAAPPFIAVGAAPGGPPLVAVFDVTGAPVASFLAFGARFGGGVRVAVGDVNADGTPDIIVASGPGGRPRVKIVDGTKLASLTPGGTVPGSALLGSFLAHQPNFQGGVHVAAGDFNIDGREDVVLGLGGGSRVKVVDATKFGLRTANGRIASTALLGDFLVYQPNFRGGVTVGAGDVNGDTVADVIAGPALGAQKVRVIDGTRLNLVQTNGRIAGAAVIAQFFAYDPGFSGGVFVAAGQVNGDNLADIITGPGPGAAPRVKVIDATKLNQQDADGQIASSALLGNVRVFSARYRDGVQVGAADLDNDGLAEILAGFGRSQRRLLGLDVLQNLRELSLALDFDAQSVGG